MTETAEAPAVEQPTAEPTFAQLREKDSKAKVPGLDLTWDDCEILDLEDDAIRDLISIKSQYRIVTLVPTELNLYVFRSCSRLAWRKIAAETLDMEKSKEQHLEESGGNPQAANLILNMMQEERLVGKLLIKPALTKQELLELPPGEVKTLYDAVMRSLGYDQPVRAIRI